jgi:hypothetical protein
MFVIARGFFSARYLILGVMLMLTVSLAKAAIAMYLPDSPIAVADSPSTARGSATGPARNISEYRRLHAARAAVVPTYLRVADEQLDR